MPLPDASAIAKLFEVITKPDAAIQLKEQFTAQAQKLGLTDKVQAAITELANFVGVVQKEASETGKSPWEGEKSGMLLTKLQRYNRALSDELKTVLTHDASLANQQVVFAFAINEQSQVQNGFSIGGKLLENKQLDALYDAWLTQHNMVSDKQGVVSVIQADKSIKKMDPRQFAAEVNNPNTGFQAFVNQEQKHVRVEVVEQPYVEEVSAPSAAG